jgi:hypothetical protein
MLLMASIFLGNIGQVNRMERQTSILSTSKKISDERDKNDSDNLELNPDLERLLIAS